jgi:hypothetical protein
MSTRRDLRRQQATNLQRESLVAREVVIHQDMQTCGRPCHPHGETPVAEMTSNRLRTMQGHHWTTCGKRPYWLARPIIGRCRIINLPVPIQAAATEHLDQRPCVERGSEECAANSNEGRRDDCTWHLALCVLEQRHSSPSTAVQAIPSVRAAA